VPGAGDAVCHQIRHDEGGVRAAGIALPRAGADPASTRTGGRHPATEMTPVLRPATNASRRACEMTETPCYYFVKASVLVARVSYVLIIGVIAVAIAAIAIVLRPDSASQPAALDFVQVVNYSKYGVVERIEAKGQTLTVQFRSSFDTKAQLGTSDHLFQSSLPVGKDLLSVLRDAGVEVNGTADLQVVSR
jgi:hypothetical protein